jgi:arylsulfatase A-like enzyme
MIKKIFIPIFSFFALLLNAQENKPNIVFIEVDDLPAHYTTMMGLKTSDTPTIDKLADQGVFFNNAIVQGTMCGPSRNSFITGVYPHNLGFYQNGPFPGLELNTWALPAALQRVGYYTAHIGKSHIHPSMDGLKGEKVDKSREAHKRLGFDYVWNSLGRGVISSREIKKGKDAYVDFLIENGYLDKIKKKEKISTLPEDIYLDGLYTKMAIDFLEMHKNETYFLWLNYSVPHGPYDVEQKYHDKFSENMAPTPNYYNDKGENIPALLRPHPIKPGKKALLDEQLGNMANISYMDYQVSRILNKIKETGHEDNTVVVFFSDHGIFVGDHGLIHKSSLYKEVLNPTLIIKDPRNKANGRVVTRPVALLDVLKTTMEIAGASKTDIDTPYGESLMPLLKDKKGYKSKFAVGESPGYYAIVTEDYKYIAPFDYQKDGVEVLFDLKNDPNETTNIADANPKTIKKFRKIAKEWLAKSGEVKIQKKKKAKKKKRKNMKKK